MTHSPSALPPHVLAALLPHERATAIRPDVVALPLAARVRYLRQERATRRFVLVVSGLLRTLLLVGGGISATAFGASGSLAGASTPGARIVLSSLGLAVVAFGLTMLRGVVQALKESAGEIPDP